VPESEATQLDYCGIYDDGFVALVCPLWSRILVWKSSTYKGKILSERGFMTLAEVKHQVATSVLAGEFQINPTVVAGRLSRQNTQLGERSTLVRVMMGGAYGEWSQELTFLGMQVIPPLSL
jgi:hypothetical protein